MTLISLISSQRSLQSTNCRFSIDHPRIILDSPAKFETKFQSTHDERWNRVGHSARGMKRARPARAWKNHSPVRARSRGSDLGPFLFGRHDMTKQNMLNWLKLGIDMEAQPDTRERNMGLGRGCVSFFKILAWPGTKHVCLVWFGPVQARHVGSREARTTPAHGQHVGLGRACASFFKI